MSKKNKFFLFSSIAAFSLFSGMIVYTIRLSELDNMLYSVRDASLLTFLQIISFLVFACFSIVAIVYDMANKKQIVQQMKNSRKVKGLIASHLQKFDFVLLSFAIVCVVATAYHLFIHVLPNFELSSTTGIGPTLVEEGERLTGGVWRYRGLPYGWYRQYDLRFFTILIICGIVIVSLIDAIWTVTLSILSEMLMRIRRKSLGLYFIQFFMKYKSPLRRKSTPDLSIIDDSIYSWLIKGVIASMLAIIVLIALGLSWSIWVILCLAWFALALQTYVAHYLTLLSDAHLAARQDERDNLWLKNIFLYDLCHKVHHCSQPLMFNVECLKKVALPDKTASYVDKIDTASIRLNDLSKSVFQIVDSNSTLEPKFEKVKLIDVVQEAINDSNFVQHLDEKEIVFSFTYPKKYPQKDVYIKTDREFLKKYVLSIIFDNCIKHARPHTTVFLDIDSSWWHDGTRLSLKNVPAKPITVSSDELWNLGTKRADSGGFGMGLYLLRQFMKKGKLGTCKIEANNDLFEIELTLPTIDPIISLDTTHEIDDSIFDGDGHRVIYNYPHDGTLKGSLKHGFKSIPKNIVKAFAADLPQNWGKSVPQTNLCEALVKVIDKFYDSLEEERVKINLDIPKDCPAISVESEDLEALLRIIFNNAIKIALPDTYISAEIWSFGDRLEIHGISKDEIDSANQLFHAESDNAEVKELHTIERLLASTGVTLRSRAHGSSYVIMLWFPNKNDEGEDV